MANIINAITSGAGGLSTSADSSGIIQLQSGGTTIATISSTGITTQVGAPAFSAYASGNTACANNNFTKVIFASEEYDTANCFSSSRFTPNVAGYYLITGSLAWGTGTFVVGVSMFKNGSRAKDGTYINSNPSTGGVTTISAQVYLNGSTDYVEIYAYQASGGTIDVFTNGVNGTVFAGSMIRSA
jgi:hypothetical protein